MSYETRPGDTPAIIAKSSLATVSGGAKLWVEFGKVRADGAA